MFVFSCVAFFVPIDIAMTNRLAECGNFHLTALFSRRLQCRQYVISTFHFSPLIFRLTTFDFRLLSQIRCKGTKKIRTMQYIVVKKCKKSSFFNDFKHF